MPPCEHCLFEVPPAEAVRDDAGRPYCCEGCLAIASFIRGEGLGAYYRRRERGPAEPGRLAARAPLDPEPFRPLVREEGGAAEIDVFLEGMHCASCVWLLERVLEKTPGVTAARVSYATHRARVRWDPARVDLPAILARAAAAGHAARPFRPTLAAAARRAESRDLLVRFGTAAFLSAQLMVYSLALYAGWFQGMDGATRRSFGVVSALLTAPVLLYAGGPLALAAFAGLRRARFTMDSLIVLGAGAAYLASLRGLALGGAVYFDTAAMIVTLVLLGRWLESLARARATDALERLAELTPAQAVRVAPGPAGAPVRERVAVDALRPGDRVEVLPGGGFPADGVVVEGESAADESLLTGESLPVPKLPGDRVVAGSLNANGFLLVAVERTGAKTALARIVAAVEEAQASRAPIQRLADRVVGWFVPVILAAAAATAAGHLAAGADAERALFVGVSVVVIACPCSLGLATPLATVLAVERAARAGVLFKNGEAAERAASVTHVVLDKTGTLTRGAFALRELRTAGGPWDPERCLRLAAALEERSGHALGAPLVAAAGAAPLPAVTGFAAHPGRGVAAVVDGERVLVGSRDFLLEQGIDPAPLESPPPAGGGGSTCVYLGRGREALARFVLGDVLRDEAPGAVRELRAAGLAVSLVSGDGAAATAAAARESGITDLEAGALPERKREIVARIQAAGGTVLAVGDGVNDAPALAEAGLGVAIGRGADVARESAGVVLLRADLRLVPWLVALSRGTFRIVRQNLFWAFFYNAAALPVAAAGLLHPIVAAAAMTASSTFVVANSLRVARLPGPGGARGRQGGGAPGPPQLAARYHAPQASSAA